jgi:CMP-N-acetylneuraminic acid synthetase
MATPAVMGLIPARGGSVGIKRKNLALLAGRPLLAYSCEAARESRRVARTFVSTDDSDIADAARAFGVEVLPRPAALAGSQTPMLDVVRHAIRTLAADGHHFDILVVLQPTSPLRRAEHIDRAVDLLIDSGADGVVSVVEVPHAFTPASLMTMQDGRLHAAVSEGSPLLRQHKTRVYARNGPAVLAVRTASALTRGLYEGDLRGFPMERECSVDIDEPADLDLAEYWLRQRTPQ